MNVIFSADASHVMDEVEKDAGKALLVDVIWDAIDLITEHPASAPARRRALRTPGGHSVWLVPIHGIYNDKRWVLLWQPRGDDVLIPYIGPEDFRSPYIYTDSRARDSQQLVAVA